MGNQHCCQPGNKGQNKIQRVQNIDYHPEILPQLSEPIQKLLNQKKPFEQQLNAQPQKVTKQYGNQFYEGPVDNVNRPSGYGKMFKEDGSLVISHFKQGVSQGPSVIIFPDGSFYQGCLANNKADDLNGRYVNTKIKYEGGFNDNAFDGKGKQIGEGYTFQGQYIKGRRAKGILKWKQNEKQYSYDGEFNQNFEFENEGTLNEEEIGVYKGSFKNGKKQGTGSYSYTNGMRYQGDYKNGVKQGTGTIYNYDNTIAYSGSFANDLPNGQGYIIQNGKKIYAQFKDGLDVLTLPEGVKQN